MISHVLHKCKEKLTKVCVCVREMVREGGHFLGMVRFAMRVGCVASCQVQVVCGWLPVFFFCQVAGCLLPFASFFSLAVPSAAAESSAESRKCLQLFSLASEIKLAAVATRPRVPAPARPLCCFGKRRLCWHDPAGGCDWLTAGSKRAI